MCGRFSLDAEASAVIEHFSLLHNIVLKPRYNIAPSQLVPVIRTPGQFEFLTWGLRPSWLKEGQNSFINARIETINEKPAFNHAFKKRRCLIVANGYYEWKPVGKHKQPYFISLPSNALFAFAGIWSTETCAIITQTTTQLDLLPIHNRMPLIIPPAYYAEWLDPKMDPAVVQSKIHSLQGGFISRPVSTKVNSPQNDFVECTMALQ